MFIQATKSISTEFYLAHIRGEEREKLRENFFSILFYACWMVPQLYYIKQ